MERLLEGHVAVVTGGGRDLGRDIALALAQHGANIVVCGRTAEFLEAAAKDVREAGANSLAVVADLRVEEDVIRLFDTSVKQFGYVSLLVNNAASERLVSPVASMPLVGWNDTISTKLTSAMLCSREALRSMIARQQGSIINISGTTGLQGPPNMSAHAVAQRGLIGLTQSTAKEVGKYGVRVNAVVPSAIEGASFSRQVASRSAPGVDSEQAIADMAAASVTGRLVQPEEVTDAVVFLASARSSGITGQTINLLL